MNEPEDIIEAIKKAVFLAKKHAEVKYVHVTRDFYLRLKAHVDIQTIALLIRFEYHLFGYETKIHNEPCDEDYWFEDVDGNKIVFDLME